MTETTEGYHRCSSCLQWVGTAPDGETRPYRTWLGSAGRRLIFCADSAACGRRWQGTRDAERFATSEARTYFPEPDDEEDEP